MGTFRKASTNACKKAGVSGSLFHDLRQTAVRNMIRAGIDQAVAMAISGHRTDAIFRRYNITTDEDLRQAQGKLEGYIAALPVKSNLVPMEQVG